MIKTYDIAIVGAGMVGQTLALLLAEHGFSIALIEKNSKPNAAKAATDINDFANRVSAITPYSEFLLNKVNAWATIERQRLCRYERMTVWEENGTATLDFQAHDIASDHLGTIIENPIIVYALFEQCEANRQIDLYLDAQIEKIHNTETGCSVQLQNQPIVHADLLVGSDGALSWVRKHLHIPTTENHLGQMAIVATIKTEQPHQAVALQRFTNQGALAFLPLRDEQTQQYAHSIVWSCPLNTANEWLAAGESAFVHQLQKHCPPELGNITECSSLQAFPLIARHAEHYVQQRAVLIGDAAHTVHPLAGQGVNLGFLDAAALAEELIKSKTKGIEWQQPLVLARFERRRRWHNQLMQKSFNGLNQLYLVQNPVLTLLRNQGVSLVNRFEPIKRILSLTAIGKTGDLPFEQEWQQ
ncbi:MAG: UbiH/UbiF/VisC/COQ6 family ubiquinone biosynthesis hydroxylase [Pseudomonadota bacterium]|nr:UbiH/UbiF/VisC/COQ6 family ubiquinone biosynthesis hydroxylase [Pseudomonadota bacterium]